MSFIHMHLVRIMYVEKWHILIRWM
jgi:hypothetical protein